LDELLSRRGAQVGCEPVEVYALCLELKPDRPSPGRAWLAHTHIADPGEGARPKPSAMSAEAGQSAVSILAEPFELTACCLVSPDRPGCGIKWDERAVRRFRLAT
jgi:L-alanine-DL-glutamate epimerase-like enolase superfamily enzyme